MRREALAVEILATIVPRVPEAEHDSVSQRMLIESTHQSTWKYRRHRHFRSLSDSHREEDRAQDCHQHSRQEQAEQGVLCKPSCRVAPIDWESTAQPEHDRGGCGPQIRHDELNHQQIEPGRTVPVVQSREIVGELKQPDQGPQGELADPASEWREFRFVRHRD